jgi:hypothetical protein
VRIETALRFTDSDGSSVSNSVSVKRVAKRCRSAAEISFRRAISQSAQERNV